VKGLGETVIFKLLAICYPDRYLCVYPYSGERGKLRMLRALDLPEPAAGTSRGYKHIDSNNRLWERLAPHFPDDPWGMMCFLYWYIDYLEDGGASDDEPDPLDAAATDLLVERSFLDDIEELLRDKGQVILYGPPGTGKTYLAQRLAAALARDPADRALVQFHPLYVLRGLLRGLPTRGRTGGPDRLPADPGTAGAHGRTSRAALSAPTGDGDR